MANENNENFIKNNEQSCTKEAVESTNEPLNQTDVTTTTPEKQNNSSTNVQTTMDEAIGLAAACTSGKLNDLVADLCITSTSTNSSNQMGRNQGIVTNSSYGDYTNIRATTSTARVSEVSSNSCLPDSSTEIPTTIATTQQAPVQNSTSSFSFKHFLNSSNSVTAPSTTVTSLDPVSGTASSSSNVNCTTTSTAAASPSTTTNAVSNPMQTSTGARPKVPQSVSASATISLMTGGLSVLGNSSNSQDASTSKMKRSPRFSSFDSQASLAEYAGAPLDRLGSGFETCSLTSSHNMGGMRLVSDVDPDDSCDDFFNSKHYGKKGSSSSSNDYDKRQYVPRSQSNFDLQTSSPRRRLGGNLSARPTRLALNYNASSAVSSSSTTKMKLDLPFDSAGNYSAGAGGTTGAATTGRQQAANLNEYPPAAAAALPDFVQDHWLDSWYAHDVHLNSPPNSPISDFVDEVPVATMSTPTEPADLSNEAAAAANGSVGSSTAGCSSSAPNDTSVGSKMLPDFLSDGPIIHSSQRLADVAVGLPSNSTGSPDESLMATQLSRVFSDNERLQRELTEVRVALNEQTRRSNELERQLQDQKRRESANAEKQKTNQPDELSKLQQQLANLKAEIGKLRRENELLREEGAVGGAVGAASHEASSFARASSTSTAGATGGCSNVRSNSGRPSKTHQLSKDLRMAATTAESHLRQLLAGVDNLRQMATQIDNTDYVLESDACPDLFTDFPDGCFDYDDYPGPTS